MKNFLGVSPRPAGANGAINQSECLHFYDDLLLPALIDDTTTALPLLQQRFVRRRRFLTVLPRVDFGTEEGVDKAVLGDAANR